MNRGREITASEFYEQSKNKKEKKEKKKIHTENSTDFASCVARSTINLARSASWAATCLASMAAEYSVPKDKSVMDTSSMSMKKASERSVKVLRICDDTDSRCVMSSAALNWACKNRINRGNYGRGKTGERRQTTKQP